MTGTEVAALRRTLDTLVVDASPFTSSTPDDKTAIWVRPDRTLEVLGIGWVEIYDPAQAVIAHDSEGRLSAKGVTFHVLTRGQRYQLVTRTVLE